MMRQRAFIAVTVLLLCLPVSFVNASPNNTLQWGVQTNEQFTYDLQRKQGDPGWINMFPTWFNQFPAWINQFNELLSFIPSMDEGQQATVTVTGLQTIPSRINTTDEMPNSFCTLVRQNDSAQLVTNSTLFVVLIGDWNFLTHMSGFENTSLTLINTDSEWGASQNIDVMGYSGKGTFNYYQEIRYEKQNGTLNYLELRVSSRGNYALNIVFVHWHAGMPTVLAPELQTTPIVAAVAGLLSVGLVSVASVFVYRMQHRRKSIAQKSRRMTKLKMSDRDYLSHETGRQPWFSNSLRHQTLYLGLIAFFILSIVSGGIDCHVVSSLCMISDFLQQFLVGLSLGLKWTIQSYVSALE